MHSLLVGCLSLTDSLEFLLALHPDASPLLGFDALVDFDAQVSLGDDKLTIGELKKLLAETEGLAFIKGKWVEVDHEKLKETLLAYEKAQKLIGRNDMTMLEAMRFQLNPAESLNLGNNAAEIEITNGEWLNHVVARLTHPENIEKVKAKLQEASQVYSKDKDTLAWCVTNLNSFTNR